MATKKVMRTIMPAHPGGSITVEQAMEAFRAIRREAQQEGSDRTTVKASGSRGATGKRPKTT